MNRPSASRVTRRFWRGVAAGASKWRVIGAAAGAATGATGAGIEATASLSVTSWSSMASSFFSVFLLSPEGFAPGAAGGAGEDFAKSFAPVGQRAEVEGPIGVAFAQGGGGVGAGGGRGEGVFEFIEGEEDAHGEGAVKFEGRRAEVEL